MEKFNAHLKASIDWLANLKVITPRWENLQTALNNFFFKSHDIHVMGGTT